MNLPNFLTIFRILALPVCAWALFKNGGDDSTWRILTWSLFFIVGLTDVLDGKIARSRNQISSFGIILDPIADKALIATALIGLSIQDRIPWWITIVILVREFSVTFLRFAVIKREIISASRGGKLKTLIQGFAVGFYILPIPHYLYFPRDLLLGVAVFLTISTGLDYFKSALKKSAPLR